MCACQTKYILTSFHWSTDARGSVLFVVIQQQCFINIRDWEQVVHQIANIIMLFKPFFLCFSSCLFNRALTDTLLHDKPFCQTGDVNIAIIHPLRIKCARSTTNFLIRSAAIAHTVQNVNINSEYIFQR